ncbi:Patatin-like phospholipase domain-containing protein 2 [Labeo rohita]|uniref:Patatin-like phospholipase domain-containing protein 2 n=1 Tax=Labeo rohita TaxID=84645 RepID=A0ABQ8MLV7_LABRO|nr:Patatin-like phospholipase domain-containing protein 2 [Labeo rohita]
MNRKQEVRQNEINEEEEKRWDKVEPSEEIKTDTELPEEYYHGLEDLPWNLNSLEQLLYISLPTWIQRVFTGDSGVRKTLHLSFMRASGQPSITFTLITPLISHLLYRRIMPGKCFHALLCNLAEQFGIWTFHNNILPCRLISYTLLPYTLPATAVISFIYRFLYWVKKIPHKVLNTCKEFKQEVIAHLRLVFAHLRGLLSNRSLLLQVPALLPTLALFLAPWSCFASLPFAFLPCSSFPLLSLALRFLPRRLSTSTSNNQPECRSQTQPLWSRQRSLFCFQLTGSGGFCKKSDNILTDAEPLSSAFLLQLNLELEMDSHPEPRQFQKDTPDCEGSLLLNTEVDENLSSPFISYMDVQEED